uniref:Solute carrier organic anion transporter family member n=1 Tax=Ciona intestinalis TaxID=7719 RepID=F7ACE2_CIOIN
ECSSTEVETKPTATTCCNKVRWYLVVHCLLAIASTVVSAGITNINVSTLETRFSLDSAESALIVICFDISFCVVTVFVTYFGATANRPRIVGIGSAIFGLGSLVYALPHFISPLYDYGGETNTHRVNQNQLSPFFSVICNSTSQLDCTLEPNNELKKFMYVLLAGQLLLGCGSTPLYTLGLAYIEGNVAKNSASVYLGIANAAGIVGPVLGFVLGGLFLDVYVDVDQVSRDSVNLTPSDPRWVGAWWIAPLAIAGVCFLLVIPFCTFPKTIPGIRNSSEEFRLNRKSEVHRSVYAKDINQNVCFKEKVRNFHKALFLLLRNPTYTLLTLGGCSQMLIINGVSAFLAKVIENQFNITASRSALFSGVILVPAGVFGHLIGGFLVKRFQWKTPAIIKFCAATAFFVTALSPGVLMHCESVQTTGVLIPYSFSLDLNSECNSNCSCSQEFFSPVCGSDGKNYFSGCHAGCTNRQTVNQSKTNIFLQIFVNCSCIPASNDEFGQTATPGGCPTTCSKLPAWLAIAFLMVFFTFIAVTPALVVTFRIVPESLRSFGLGIQWLFLRGLGGIPGPFLYGSFIDSICILWQMDDCDGSRGSCWVYDNQGLAVRFMAITLAGHFFGGIFYLLSWWFYKGPPTSGVPSSTLPLDDAPEACSPRAASFSNIAFVPEA